MSEQQTSVHPLPAATDSVTALLAAWQQTDPSLDVATVAVVARMGRIRTHLELRMNQVFAEHGISAADFAALSILRRHGPVQMHALADGLYLTAGTVTPRVRRLVSAGLVAVTAQPEDARVRMVALTPAGRAKFDAVVPDHLTVQAEALRTLSPTQRTQLGDLLAVLLADLETR